MKINLIFCGFSKISDLSLPLRKRNRISCQEYQLGQQRLLAVLFKNSHSVTQQTCLSSLYLALCQMHGTQKIPVPTFKKSFPGNSLVVQWLGFSALTAGVQVQSLVGELRFLQAAQPEEKKKPFLLVQDIMVKRECRKRTPSGVPAIFRHVARCVIIYLVIVNNFKNIEKTCNFPKIPSLSVLKIVSSVV